MDGVVDAQNILEWRYYLLHVGIHAATKDLLQNPKYLCYWSSASDPADQVTSEYDLIVHYGATPSSYELQSSERLSFLRSIKSALKPDTGRFLLVDYRESSSQSRADPTAGNKENTIKAEVEAAGFEIIRETEALFFLMDDLKQTAWTNLNGESGRCALLLSVKK